MTAGGMTSSDTDQTPVLTAAVYRVLLIEDDAGDALLVEEYLADTALQVELQWAQTLAELRSEAHKTAATVRIPID